MVGCLQRAQLSLGPSAPYYYWLWWLLLLIFCKFHSAPLLLASARLYTHRRKTAHLPCIFNKKVCAPDALLPPQYILYVCGILWCAALCVPYGAKMHFACDNESVYMWYTTMSPRPCFMRAPNTFMLTRSSRALYMALFEIASNIKCM